MLCCVVLCCAVLCSGCAALSCNSSVSYPETRTADCCTTFTFRRATRELLRGATDPATRAVLDCRQRALKITGGIRALASRRARIVWRCAQYNACSVQPRNCKQQPRWYRSLAKHRSTVLLPVSTCLQPMRFTALLARMYHRCRSVKVKGRGRGKGNAVGMAGGLAGVTAWHPNPPPCARRATSGATSLHRCAHCLCCVAER